MRLIPYVRVSTEDQAEQGHSLTAQETSLQRHAALAGIELTAVVADEGVSAGRLLAMRKGGAVLLDMLRNDRAAGVLVTRIDRLFRNVLDAVQFLDECARRGWTVVSTTEHVDTATPAGRLSLNIMLATAAYEREIACVRTSAVSRSLRERGKVYGVVPFGVRALDGAMVRDPRTWGIREQIVEWHQGRRYSLRTIRSMLHDLRIPAPAGGRWWSTSTLANVIDTHASLSHLPLLHGGNDAPAPSLTDKGDVSRDADIEHNSTGNGTGVH